MNDPLKILDFYRKRGIPREKIPYHCGFGKVLAAWFATTELPPAGYVAPVISLKGAPVPYEVEFSMSNADDCADWLAENYVDKDI